MTILEAEQQIINEFSLFDDWMDRYNYIIELGKSMPMIDDKYKTDQYLITGCQSRVWLYAEYEDGKVVFSADSDAIITKGIVNLLIRVRQNKRPKTSSMLRSITSTKLVLKNIFHLHAPTDLCR